MDGQTFIQGLDGQNEAINVADLRMFLNEYPYCQPARILRVKGLQLKGSTKFKDELRLAAAYAYSREKLWDRIEVATQDVSMSADSSGDTELGTTAITLSSEDTSSTKDPLPKEDTGELIPITARDRFRFSEWLQLSEIAEFKREEGETAKPLELSGGDASPEQDFSQGLEEERVESSAGSETSPVDSALEGVEHRFDEAPKEDPIEESTNEIHEQHEEKEEESKEGTFVNTDLTEEAEEAEHERLEEIAEKVRDEEKEQKVGFFARLFKKKTKAKDEQTSLDAIETEIPTREEEDEDSSPISEDPEPIDSEISEPFTLSSLEKNRTTNPLDNENVSVTSYGGNKEEPSVGFERLPEGELTDSSLDENHAPSQPEEPEVKAKETFEDEAGGPEQEHTSIEDEASGPKQEQASIEDEAGDPEQEQASIDEDVISESTHDAEDEIGTTQEDEPETEYPEQTSKPRPPRSLADRLAMMAGKKGSGTGDQGQGSEPGDGGLDSATGDQEQASATSDEGQGLATGDQGQSSGPGDGGLDSATGDQEQASATGDEGQASATGDQEQASATSGEEDEMPSPDIGASTKDGDTIAEDERDATRNTEEDSAEQEASQDAEAEVRKSASDGTHSEPEKGSTVEASEQKVEQNQETEPSPEEGKQEVKVKSIPVEPDSEPIAPVAPIKPVRQKMRIMPEVRVRRINLDDPDESIEYVRPKPSPAPAAQKAETKHSDEEAARKELEKNIAASATASAYTLASSKEEDDSLPKLRPKGKGLKSSTSKPKVDLASISTQENDDNATETLAKIYIAQGYYDKAIQAYKILRLKYPEKSDLFADQISQLKKKLKK